MGGGFGKILEEGDASEEGGNASEGDSGNLPPKPPPYVASYKASDKNAAPTTKDPFDSQLKGQRFQQQSAQHY